MRWKEYLPYYKRNLKVAFPVMVTQIGASLVGLIDSIMVGHYATTDFAAVSFSNAIFFSVMVFAMGLLMGVTPLVGYEVGQQGGEAERQRGGEAERRRGGEAERQRGREAKRRRGGEAERQRGREAERQRSREAERRKGGEAERRKGREAERRKARYRLCLVTAW